MLSGLNTEQFIYESKYIAPSLVIKYWPFTFTSYFWVFGIYLWYGFHGATLIFKGQSTRDHNELVRLIR